MINNHHHNYFRLFPKEFKVSGVQEEREDVEGKGVEEGEKEG